MTAKKNICTHSVHRKFTILGEIGCDWVGTRGKTGDGAVVDVAADQNGVGALLIDDQEDLGEDVSLVLQHLSLIHIVTTLEEGVLDEASYFGRIFARCGGLAEAVAQGCLLYTSRCV